MSQEGSIKFRLSKLDEEIDAEMKRYQAAGFPPPMIAWHMGDSEFMHHCHVWALTALLREKLGVTEEEVDLHLKTVFRDEMRKLYVRLDRERVQAMQKSIIIPDIKL